MNLRRLTGRWPNLDLRRIDLIIRDESAWDRGTATQAIRTLTHFAFDREGADAIFACDIVKRDMRAIRALQDAGYTEEVRRQAPARTKGEETIDLVIWRNPAPGAGLPVDDPYLTEAEVLECLRLLNRALSMPFWITGGVGVDLLVGRLTRPHGDIDLCIDRRNRAVAFADLPHAGFRVTKDLGWHTRWSRSSRAIGELGVCFTTIRPDGSTILIVCPEDGIGEPGRYPGPPGTFDEQRYGEIADVQCRVESAESQLQLRQGYRALFPVAAEDPKVHHDLDLLTTVIGPDRAAPLAIVPLHREDLLPGDCGD
jgi:lincosamide nucleotidyltransferase A/C/D/E